MGTFDKIVEQQVRTARDRGLFDDLAGHGKPIPDLDRPRRHGWWAERFVKREREAIRRDELTIEIERAMPALWRMETEEQVAAAVAVLNEQVDEFNGRRPFERFAPIDPDATALRWRELSDWR